MKGVPFLLFFVIISGHCLSIFKKDNDGQLSFFEYPKSNMFGESFISQIHKSFYERRNNWNVRDGNINSPLMSSNIDLPEELQDSIETGDSPIFERQYPLNVILVFLHRFWKNYDPDYPSEKKLKGMELDELFQ